VFEKTQTQKYALSESRKGRKMFKKRPRQITDYGLQLIEKQKARYSYNISEKQFANEVKSAIKQDLRKPAEVLFENLENRLDSILARSGLCPSRPFGRQAISHGHIEVNGKRVNIPSYKVKVGDVVSFKPSSLNKGLFSQEKDQQLDTNIPSWISVDNKNKKITVKGTPKIEEVDLLFNIDSVLEFYSR